MFRSMRRANQALDRATCQRILRETPRGVLAVQGDDGYPYALPINFVYDETQGEYGSIYFHSALSGHKVDAMGACDKVSFTAMDQGYRNEGEWWYYVRSVICFGRAHPLEDPQRKHDALACLAEKYFPSDYDIEGDIAKNAHRVHMYEVRIEHLSGKLVQEK